MWYIYIKIFSIILRKSNRLYNIKVNIEEKFNNKKCIDFKEGKKNRKRNIEEIRKI